jgi:hypothetical protein
MDPTGRCGGRCCTTAVRTRTPVAAPACGLDASDDTLTEVRILYKDSEQGSKVHQCGLMIITPWSELHKSKRDGEEDSITLQYGWYRTTRDQEIASQNVCR